MSDFQLFQSTSTILPNILLIHILSDIQVDLFCLDGTVVLQVLDIILRFNKYVAKLCCSVCTV